jgi:hypothetical protein
MSVYYNKDLNEMKKKYLSGTLERIIDSATAYGQNPI